MSVESCIPIVPSTDLEKSLRLWFDGLGFSRSREMKENGKLIFCMLQKGSLWFMLNRRAGNAIKCKDYEGIRLYWAPTDIKRMRQRLHDLGFRVSEIVQREYGQAEFFLTDDDGYLHCFGSPSQK